MTTQPKDLWLVPIQTYSDRIRLFCFPYGGGSSSHIFMPWRDRLPAEIGIYGVQLPGRGLCIHEPLLTGVREVVEAVADALAPMLDRPFALFGTVWEDCWLTSCADLPIP